MESPQATRPGAFPARPATGLFGAPPLHDPNERLHRGGGHVVLGGKGPHRVANGAVLADRRIVASDLGGAAHPNIDRHRVHVSGDIPGERVRLRRSAEGDRIEADALRQVCLARMVTQTANGRTYGEVECLADIGRPMYPGRECRDDRSGDLHIVGGIQLHHALRDGTGVPVPHIGVHDIGQGGALHSAAECGHDRRCSGGGHASIITYSPHVSIPYAQISAHINL